MDISLCRNHSCHAGWACYRYRAIPDEHWQAYGKFGNETLTACKDFEPVRQGDNVRTMEEIEKELARGKG